MEPEKGKRRRSDDGLGSNEDDDDDAKRCKRGEGSSSSIVQEQPGTPISTADQPNANAELGAVGGEPESFR